MRKSYKVIKVIIVNYPTREQADKIIKELAMYYKVQANSLFYTMINQKTCHWLLTKSLKYTIIAKLI